MDPEGSVAFVVFWDRQGRAAGVGSSLTGEARVYMLKAVYPAKR